MFTRAVMAREGITVILSNLHGLPPAALSEQARRNFIRQALIAYAWCIREEQLFTIVTEFNKLGKPVTNRALDELRATATGEAERLLRDLAIAAEFFAQTTTTAPSTVN